MIAACIVIKTSSGSGGGVAPVANFDISNDAPNVGEAVFFTDTSTNNPTSWQWTVDSSIFSFDQNPSYYLGRSGYFTFQLTATNQYGSSSHSQQIFVSDGNPP